MPTVEEIRWLAAWLEGEGSFFLKQKGKSKQINLDCCSTDYDVMQTAQKILNHNMVMVRPHHTSGGFKMQYRITLVGFEAAQWMMTLYILMHERRRFQIKKCLDFWKKIKFNYATNR